MLNPGLKVQEMEILHRSGETKSGWRKPIWFEVGEPRYVAIADLVTSWWLAVPDPIQIWLQRPETKACIFVKGELFEPVEFMGSCALQTVNLSPPPFKCETGILNDLFDHSQPSGLVLWVHFDDSTSQLGIHREESVAAQVWPQG